MNRYLSGGENPIAKKYQVTERSDFRINTSNKQLNR